MSEDLRAEVARLTGEVSRLGKAVDALIENELRKSGEHPMRRNHPVFQTSDNDQKELPAIRAALETLVEIERARDSERKRVAKRVLVTINPQDCSENLTISGANC